MTQELVGVKRKLLSIIYGKLHNYIGTKFVRDCTSREQMVFMKLKIVLCQHAILLLAL